MAIKNRNALKTIFSGKILPTKGNYADLIDSTLNRKDDHFFGVWQQGKRYCQRDVVIYGKSLYLLDLPAEEEIQCGKNGKENGGEVVVDGEYLSKTGKQQPSEVVVDAPTDPRCICSEVAPPDDVRWCELQLEVDDRDWEVILDEEEEQPVIVYQLRARIGVGTDDPGTRLQVTGPAGDIQLDPDGAAPLASLVTNLEGGSRVDWSLRESSDYQTTSLGYAFFRTAKPSYDSAAMPKDGSPNSASPSSPAPASAPQLLFFLSSEGKRITAGIGTPKPAGILHAEDEGYGRLVVNSRRGNEAATVLLVDCTEENNGHYLLSGVNQNIAYLQTDASEGLRIIMGGSYGNLDEGMGKGLTAVAIDRQGNVGIGTETPRSKLEVTEEDMGTVRVDFSKDNVCISTINERPQPERPKTYHGMGVDDEFATLITDAPSGFAFKAGRPSDDEHEFEVDINQGETVAHLSRAGRLGLRTNQPPSQFDLHVNGHQLSQTAYLETNGQRIESDGKLDGEEVLQKLKKLHPIYFNWRASANASDAGRQIGFNAQNVFECFPELIRTADSNKMVAYGNMTAVLAAAIKEQQRIISTLDQRICDLEEQLNGDDTAKGAS